MRVTNGGTIDTARHHPNALSPKGARFIARFEGFRARAYNDAAEPPNATIGYGHMLHRGPITHADEGLVWSDAHAIEVLGEDAASAARFVAANVHVFLTQQQFDALVSFTFNVGTGAFAGSTVLRLVNAHEFAKVPAALMEWVHAGAVVLPGIVNRRRAEGELFVHGTYGI